VARITDYASLQATVALWLNRSDLTSVIPNFIQNAEAYFMRMDNIRTRATVQLTVDAQDIALPADCAQILSISHVGGTYFGPIDFVTADEAARRMASFGWGDQTGVPRCAFISAEGTVRFLPAPDVTYTLSLQYMAKLSPLSNSNTVNWLLQNHPDLYLYGTLLESAPYLKNDARVAVWKSIFDERMDDLTEHREGQLYPTTVVRRLSSAMGV
jgi:hypothetical protein